MEKETEKTQLLLRYAELDGEVKSFLQKLLEESESLQQLALALEKAYTDDVADRDPITDCADIVVQHPTFESMQGIQDALFALLFTWKEMLQVRSRIVNGAETVN